MRRTSEGATILELVVAVMLLTIGLLPLLLALNRISLSSYSLGTRSEAQLLAAQRIDEIQSWGFARVENSYLDTVASTTVNEGALAQRPYSRSTVITYQKSSGATFVDAVISDSHTDYIKLRCTVSWRVETQPISRTLTAMMTRDGSLE